MYVVFRMCTIYVHTLRVLRRLWMLLNLKEGEKSEGVMTRYKSVRVRRKTFREWSASSSGEKEVNFIVCSVYVRGMMFVLVTFCCMDEGTLQICLSVGFLYRHLIRSFFNVRKRSYPTTIFLLFLIQVLKTLTIIFSYLL